MKRYTYRMKTFQIQIFGTILIAVFVLLPVFAAAQFADGSGTEEEPWQIATVGQLQNVGQQEHLSGHFILIADIDASETANWNEGDGFEPIGGYDNESSSTPFNGSFDGNGFTINNLTIDRSDESYIGFFGVVDNGSIRNVRLEQINITGDDNVGGLIGYREGGLVIGSCTSGIVTGNNLVGGLIGGSFGDVHSSCSYADVSGNEYVGGLIGMHMEASVEESYASGHVTGQKFVGGLAGMSGVMLHASYATGDVAGTSRVGGLVGGNNGALSDAEKCIVSQSYSTGTVTGEEETGGFAGWNPWEITSSYWNTETSGKPAAVGSDPEVTPDVINEVKGLGTDQMTGQNAYIHMYQFDFNQTWQLTEGYPVLAWQDPENAVDRPEVPIIRVDTTMRDFGLVSTDRTDTVEVSVRNTGNNVLSGEVFLGGPDAGRFAIAGELSGFTLEAGSSQAVAVTFQPGSLESYQAELNIVHDAPNRSDSLIIPLSGEGKEPTFVSPDPDRPRKVQLHQNYPNPFNPATQIRFALPEQVNVTLTVYNLIGQQVATLVHGTRSPGWHDVTFDASGLSSGVFIYQIKVEDYVETRQMMFVK